MESASKALIIAGAILIVILLITIGIFLINSAKSNVDTATAQMSSQSIQAFNSQFALYEGSNKSAKEVLSLIDTVIASNASNYNKIAIDLVINIPDGLPQYIRTYTYKHYKENETVDGAVTTKAGNVSEAKSLLNKYSNYKYNVVLFYCNETTLSKNNIKNKDLNLVNGTIMAVKITNIINE